MPPGSAPAAPAATAAPPRRARPAGVVLPPSGDTWVDVTSAPLGAAAVGPWATTADCGAVVTFSGTVRDHAPGRDAVSALTYEAYVEAAVDRMAAVVDDVRTRWPDVRRVAALHRTGRLEVGDVAVVVAVSAPHREAAFAAAAHCIDTLKATVPLWKKETWAEGEEWGTDATPLADPGGEADRR
ncbi:molybdenum cofactor biosynthesis protein MoaE [Iamia majanohamensis]|uniref:Molybdenum cofactor biosynthesis protein MoaE n=1 Tax=Iamia majanohamensis TaxID=467976 RepID=A0AAE9Y6N1_9ACTN|nr:molybdenum cofactor biosynthesis protein MoaE [Iamia majanohamensis]WCO67542.1 molybdenum cofactor biosynthesis protein MoaE [Iamia majanohamensis]